jgi:hypothetical protein
MTSSDDSQAILSLAHATDNLRVANANADMARRLRKGAKTQLILAIMNVVIAALNGLTILAWFATHGWKP